MAGKFRFRLQPVLEQRERVERERQLRVAELDRERLVIEERLRRLNEEMQGAKADLRGRLSLGGGAVAIPEVRMQANTSLHLAARARITALELAGAMRRLERARQELLEAARAARAVELLKEKRFEEWRQNGARAEAMQVDEAATQQFARVQREEAIGRP